MSDSPGRREVAHRLFAAEYDDADFEYSESDEERAPNYVVTPTGARVNRLFAVGVLTEVEQVGEEVLRARVVDPTGAFVVYAGQYQPEAMAFLEDADTPAFVAVTGKARTFSPEDSDVIYTSIRPESVSEVDADTRDRWTVRTAEHTLARAATFDAALDAGLAGDALRTALADAEVPESLAAGIPVALDHYGTTEHYLSSMADVAVDALRLVADEVDEVTVSDVSPDAGGDGTVDSERLTTATDLVGDLGAVELEAPSEQPGEEVAGKTVEEPAAASGTEDGPADATTTTGSDDAETSASAATGTETDDVGDFDEDGDDGGGDDGGGDDGGGDDGGGDDVGEFATDADGNEDDVGDFEAEPSDETETATGDASDDGVVGDDVGDEEPAADVDLDDPPEEVLDEEERERIEEEYGTDFQTGTEVDEPGEADIEPAAEPIDPEEMESAASEPADTDDVGDFDAGGGASAGAKEAEAEPESKAEPEAEDTEPEEPEPEATEPAEPGDTGPEDAEPEEPAGDDTTAEDEPEPADEPARSAEDVDLTKAVLETMEELDDGTGADREELVASVVDDYGVSENDVEDAIEDALMGGQCYEPGDGKLSAI